MGIFRHRITLWLAVSFLFFVIVSAARIGVADLIEKSAREKIFSWSAIAPSSVSTSLDNVSSQLDAVRLLASDNPDYYEDMASLAMMRSAMPGTNKADRNERLTEGFALIRQAIALRPVSPYAWAMLLQLKRERGEYDAEFRHALERAVTLGPWEPQVQLVVADVGQTAWAALPPLEQDMLQENLVRGMKRQASSIISIVQSHLKDCNSSRATINAGCSK